MNRYVDPVWKDEIPVLQSWREVDSLFATNGFKRPDDLGTGLTDRDYAKQPLGSGFGASAMDLKIIPKREWDDRIDQLAKDQSRNYDWLRQFKVPFKNQGSLPYCWAFSSTHATEACRLRQFANHIALSPASIGALATKFRKVGGWPSEWFEVAARQGICTEQEWPATAVEKRYDNDETRLVRRGYSVTKWFDLMPQSRDAERSLLEFATCLLAGHGVAEGRSKAWGHSTYAADWVRWQPGRYGVLTRNSWRGWGFDGWAVIDESIAGIDGGCAPVSVHQLEGGS